ncbi:MAG: SprT-like domain-containing protein [Clostridiales bacterium]|nr:SprT-like domain-containing protein [Clostridiales bacterium]
MKEITKMSRLTGCLEKCFRLVNADLFDNELPTPMITCVPTSRAYAHITVYPVWDTKRGNKYELNISSAYLTTRPLEEVVASMIHEACHLLNIVHGVQDTSNNGVYHNKQFKRTAEEHGLSVTRSDKYGWSHTAPGDPVLQFVLDHMDELREIEMNRSIPQCQMVSIGTHSSNGGMVVTPTVTKGHSRKWVCPQCGTIIRSNKPVRVICADCMQLFVEG